MRLALISRHQKKNSDQEDQRNHKEQRCEEFRVRATCALRIRLPIRCKQKRQDHLLYQENSSLQRQDEHAYLWCACLQSQGLHSNSCLKNGQNAGWEGSSNLSSRTDFGKKISSKRRDLPNTPLNHLPLPLPFQAPSKTKRQMIPMISEEVSAVILCSREVERMCRSKTSISSESLVKAPLAK